MPQSNYSRFSDGVQISGVSMNVHQKGQVLYVCNSTVPSRPGSAVGSDGSDGKTPDRPLATITKAVSLCVASRGDKIILMPGHAEIITAAAGIVLNVAGVSIIADPTAIGAQRPTITYTTANTASLTVSAADVVVSGIVFVANFLSVATPINALNGATDLTVNNCEFRDSSAILSFTSCVNTSATANGNDGLTVIGCRFLGLGTVAAHLVVVGAALNRINVSANSVDVQTVTTATGALVLATAHALTGAKILGNDVANALTTSAAGGLIVAGSGGSGFVCDNYLSTIAASTAILITTGTGLSFFNNYVQRSAVDTSGLLLPAASS